ncbi:hypothetical protein [Streptomyces sp. NPDC048508]|uniref:hypothetical protein n=1 Tax=Streptomyces sp. NPDC048508 TaxID=3365561 RepID=UPI00371663BC
MNNVMMAAGILDDSERLIGDIKNILQNLLPPVIGAAFVLWTWMNSKSPVKTFVACIAAGAIWWGILNMGTLRDKTGEDINGGSSQLVVPVAPRDLVDSRPQ